MPGSVNLPEWLAPQAKFLFWRGQKGRKVNCWPKSFSASVVNCSMLSPRFVVEENCQLSTSATWSQVPIGGLVKKFTFYWKWHICSFRWGWYLKTCTSCPNLLALRSLKRRWVPLWWGTYLRVVGQHVIPQDGCPGIWHLTDVGDHHNWQGVSLWRRGEWVSLWRRGWGGIGPLWLPKSLHACLAMFGIKGHVVNKPHLLPALRGVWLSRPVNSVERTSDMATGYNQEPVKSDLLKAGPTVQGFPIYNLEGILQELKLYLLIEQRGPRNQTRILAFSGFL